MTRVFGAAAVLLLASANGMPAQADNPMTPSHPVALSAGWIEPPPSSQAPAPTPAHNAADLGAVVKHRTGKAEAAGDRQIAPRAVHHPRRRVVSDSPAARLKRIELSRIHSGSSAYYGRGFWPWSGY